MSILSPSGYLYATDQALVTQAENYITADWKESLPDGAYKDGTQCWDRVHLAADDSGIYFTQKQPDDSFNETAREIEGIQEGAGDLSWLPEE